MNLFPLILIFVPLLVSGLFTVTFAAMMVSKGMSLEFVVVLALFTTMTGYLAYAFRKACRRRGSLIDLSEGVEVDLPTHRRLTHLALLPLYAITAGGIIYGLAQLHSLRYWLGITCALLAVQPIRLSVSRLARRLEGTRPEGEGPSATACRRAAAILTGAVTLLAAKVALWYWILGLARYVSLFDLLAGVVLVVSLAVALLARPPAPRGAVGQS